MIESYRAFQLWAPPRCALRPWLLYRSSESALRKASCGAIRPFIPDLIQAGVQILNPMQPNADGMDPAGLKRDFGDRLTFYGGVDTQELLPRGTPEQVFFL